MQDEGFTRNLRAVFGFGDDYADMAGKPLVSVVVSDDKERVVFAFADGSEARFRVEGDCCSSSWIEHVDVPPAAIGQELTGVNDALAERREERENYEVLQVYKTTFHTACGDIVLEYRNSSNGYYGGYLVRER